MVVYIFMIDSEFLFETARRIMNESKSFQKITIKITNKEDTRHDNGHAVVCINPTDPLILRGDKDFINLIVRKEIYKSELRKGERLPEFLEDILLNKRIIKEGLGDVLESYYYILMNDHMSFKVQDQEKFLKINIPWISFYGMDNYRSEYFKKLSKRFRDVDQFEEMNSKLLEYSKTPYVKLREICEEAEKIDANN